MRQVVCRARIRRVLAREMRAMPVAAGVVELEGVQERTMEFNCPTCQTKLRVSDERQNPKVRCRACGTIFRPLDLPGSSGPPLSSPAAPARPPFNPAPQPSRSFETPFESSSASTSARDSFGSPTSPAPAAPRPVITPRRTQGSKRGGWGIMFFIILMLLSRGPRLLRNFNRQPAPPPPVQIDHDKLMRQLREMRERAEAEELGDMPTSPEGADPNQVPVDGEAP